MNIPPYPYHLSSAEQCRRMDERTINEFGISGFTLMEIAGTKAADFILSKTKSRSHGLFVCGKGNNAGDALVVARILSEKDYLVTICFIEGTESLSHDTSKNLELLKKLTGEIQFAKWDSDIKVSDYDFVVDGLFGTGLHSEVRSPYDEVIKTLNTKDQMVFSLDIPSGLHPDSGRIMGEAVRATYTITFGALKTGFYLNHGYDYSGDVILCELPFPNQYKEHTAFLIDEEWATKSMSEEKQRDHKYDGGVLYIIAGSEGLTGAATLAAKSAWATGIGAVVLITPKGLLNIYEKTLVQIIKKPVGENNEVFFTPEHLHQVTSVLKEKPGKLLIGPGLGRNPETIAFTQQLLSDFEGDVIIDADAIFALSQNEDIQKPDHSTWILAPHPGELKSLLKTDISDDHERLTQVTKTAVDKNYTILSKGFPGIIGTTSGEVYLTGYETRVFSRAGFGDILAGKLGAYLLRKNDHTSACIYALLDGQEKASNFSGSHLEPIDLI